MSLNEPVEREKRHGTLCGLAATIAVGVERDRIRRGAGEHLCAAGLCGCAATENAAETCETAARSKAPAAAGKGRCRKRWSPR